MSRQMAGSNFLRKNIMIKSIFSDIMVPQLQIREEGRSPLLKAEFNYRKNLPHDESTSWKRVTDHKSLSNLLLAL